MSNGNMLIRGWALDFCMLIQALIKEIAINRIAQMPKVVCVYTQLHTQIFSLWSKNNFCHHSWTHGVSQWNIFQVEEFSKEFLVPNIGPFAGVLSLFTIQHITIVVTLVFFFTDTHAHT